MLKFSVCFVDAFDTEQMLECVQKLKCGQSVQVPIYDFKIHRRSSDSFRQVLKSFLFVFLSFLLLVKLAFVVAIIIIITNIDL